MDKNDANKPVTDLSGYTPGDYRPGAGFPKRGCWYVTNVLFFLNPFCTWYGLKRLLLRMFGAQVGRGVIIKPRVNIKYPWHLEVGDHSWIGEQVWIDNLGRVSIGSNVCISQGAMLVCGNHNYKKDSFDLMVGEITLGEGSWIGARVILGPDSNVGSHAVIQAGSVGRGEFEPYGIYRGNPASFTRKRISRK